MTHSLFRNPAVLTLTFLVLALLFAVACGGAPTAPETDTTAKAAPTVAPVATTAPADTTAKAGTAPTSAPAAAEVPAKVVPSGKFTLAWHAGLSSNWLDPQDNPAMATPYNFAYALHDALVKTMPAGLNTPSLAESWEWDDDFKSITFHLRPGIKFHNGDPVTAEDAKFTFENYSGAQADLLQGSTESIDIIDPSTIRFNFNKPFLDFLLYYGTFASGSGFVLPAKYYQEVGSEGYIRNPIAAGPYKLIEELPGDSLEFEAFEDFYRPVHIKDFTMRSVQEPTTRMALLEAGEVDVMYKVVGELIDRVNDNPDLLLVPTLSTAVFWIELLGQHDPDNPFSDVRVREAVSLALDRQAISDAETGGYSKPTNYWIPPNILLAPEHEAPEEDLAKAKELMEAAGYGDGFEVEWLSPIPNYFTLGERVISQLKRIGINAKMQTMERGTYFDRLEQGDTYQARNEAWGPGTQMLVIGTGTAGAFTARFNAYVTCDGFASRICVPEIDELMTQYDESVDFDERDQLAIQIHEKFSAGFYNVPIYWFTFINAIGPRIANRDQWGDGKEIFASPQISGYGPPWENWKLVGE